MKAEILKHQNLLTVNFNFSDKKLCNLPSVTVITEATSNWFTYY
jgi:hypothetical protein